MWINEKDFKNLPVMDRLTCNQILEWKRRKMVKEIVRREEDGTYSVDVDMSMEEQFPEVE